MATTVAAKPSSRIEISPLEQLAERVTALETYVGIIARRNAAVNKAAAAAGDKRGGALPVLPTIGEELKELTEKWKTQEDPSFAEFFQKYTSLENYLASDKALKEILLTADMKEKMLTLAADDFKKISTLLESMQQLRGQLEKPPVADLPKFESQLDNFERATNGVQAEVETVHEQVEKFLDHYNEVIDLLSQKFLFWNATLAQWEAKTSKK